jgi:hypothetical protein
MPVPDFSPGEVLTAGAMDKIGMWELGTLTFAASTSQSIDSVFSSSYRTYLVTWDFRGADASNPDNVFLKLRKNGSDAITGYNNTWIYTLRTSASPLTAYDATGTQLTIGYVGANVASGFVYVSRPAISGPTGFVWQGGGNGPTQGIIASGQGSHTTSDVYDGLTVNGPTLTGQVKIYGLRN